VDIIGAIATATLFAVFSLPFREYHYWFRWTPPGLAAGLIIYLAFAGVAAGLLGWLLTTPLTGNPGGSSAPAFPVPPLAVGALAGLTGALLIRVDIGTRATPSTRRRHHASPTASDLAAGFSLLNVATKWTIAMMDYLVDRATERWSRQLTDKALIVHAAELAEKIRNLDIKDSTKQELWARFVPAMSDLRSLPRGHQGRIAARVRLEQFCASFLSGHRWPRPTTITHK
jgi:hypothetical protein